LDIGGPVSQLGMLFKTKMQQLNIFYEHILLMNGRSEANDSLGTYYASHRAHAIINYDGDIHELEIGKVFCEYKDNFVIIDGENMKRHEYLIPKTKVDHYGDNEVHFNISEDSLKEFEI
jgi:hypothetical protein